MTVKTLIAPASSEDGAMIHALHKAQQQARSKRDRWVGLWQECYDYALPQRDSFYGFDHAGQKRSDHLYDGTAMDSVDQLAASLLAELTPPWSQWFGFKPGFALSKDEAETIAPKLENTAQIMQTHFDRSNFATEIHQCFLDLVTAGTACLYFDRAATGAMTAFRFEAVPLSQVAIEQSENGSMDITYRYRKISAGQIQNDFVQAELPQELVAKALKSPDTVFEVIEVVQPEGLAYRKICYLPQFVDKGGEAAILCSQLLQSSPYIHFRWQKSPGEIYGRSPVMKALPDIKTANKVVELVLKNASISVTGIWQADDDGILNPANIDLRPGTIIPKAVGSQGLTPLEMPARFDVSELVLSDLRARIRKSLMVDRLAQIEERQMTATEVLERAREIVRLLGATYGRLQSELLTPLIRRGYDLLRARGEIADLALDGRYVALDYRSPMARAQQQLSVQNTLNWLRSATELGAKASEAIDVPEAVRHMGEALGVPSHLIRRELLDKGGENATS
tara:strand:+ start:49 stop:1575 length:1527 start_codon:yes stop_codon:yes gene_type:complete